MPGEPVTWRRQVLPGLGQLWAAGCHGTSKLINTASSLVARDVRARAGSWRPRVSRGPGGSPLPHLPASGLTVLGWLGASPQVLRELESKLEPGRRAGEKGSGCAGAGLEGWGSPRHDGMPMGGIEGKGPLQVGWKFWGDLGMEWGIGVTQTKMEGWRLKYRVMSSESWEQC